jgi:hypothetical protein
MVSLYESRLRFSVECIDTFRLWLKPNKNNKLYKQTYVCIWPIFIFDKNCVLCQVGPTDKQTFYS